MSETLTSLNRLCGLIESGSASEAIPYLGGLLNGWQSRKDVWPSAVVQLRAHRLHHLLLGDPYVARAYHKPRGYAGDAQLIDLIYTRQPPLDASALGRAIFDVTTAFPVCESVRLRRDYAAQRLTDAVASGQRILSLACGHFREGHGIMPRDSAPITVVDQDPESLAIVRQSHGETITIIEANVFRFLRSAVSRKEQWDYVYTLGLTDYFDDRAMTLFHAMLAKIVAPNGSALLANFLPDHLAIGWMEAVMDWNLFMRTEDDLARHAQAAGFAATTWTDKTHSIAFCEMRV